MGYKEKERATRKQGRLELIELVADMRTSSAREINSEFLAMAVHIGNPGMAALAGLFVYRCIELEDRVKDLETEIGRMEASQ